MPEHGERKARRRVGALLNSYYNVDGAESKDSKKKVGLATDQQSFDADRYFDDMVTSGHLPDLVQESDNLNAEISDLDTDLKARVFLNYNKFIGATDLIKQMKFTIDGLGPDLQQLEGKMETISHHEQQVEDGVASRSSQIELLLKQQSICKKLSKLFNLPTALKACLDRHAYGSAVEAYCNCTPILRQYQAMPSFSKVLADVELQMNRIRAALEQRLQFADLPVGEAVNSSLTLLSLGEDSRKVAQEYLSGRGAALRAIVEPLIAALPEAGDSSSNGGSSSSSAKAPAEVVTTPLWQVCVKIRELCIPSLIDTVDGFRKMQVESKGAAIEDKLTNFVKQHLTEMCEEVTKLAEAWRPPIRVLVSCLHALRDSSTKLHAQMPSLLAEIFGEFFMKVGRSAARHNASCAAACMLAELPKLERECVRLQALKAAGLDEVMVQTAKSEEEISMHIFSVLVKCRPLAALCSVHPAGDQFGQVLQEQLEVMLRVFFMASIGHVARDAGGCGMHIPPLEGHLSRDVEVVAAVGRVDISEVVDLEWSSVFSLALFRICRHMETKLISKLWSVAQEQCDSVSATPSRFASGSEPLVEHARAAAQALFGHYILVNGVRLAELMKGSIQSRNWMTVKQPQDPRVVVEVILREALICDAQLGRMLGDVRKPVEAKSRRALGRERLAMELEMERLWAKKQKIYGATPFRRSGAMMGILRIVFKAFYEYIREETFGMHGLQQIQVDCAYFADVIREFLETHDAGVLDSLLDETVGSAEQRCVEPTLMDASMVATICEERRKTFKVE